MGCVPPAQVISPPPDGGAGATDACAADSGQGNGYSITPPVIPASVFASLSTGTTAHAELCANDRRHPNFPNDGDVFIRVFCADVDGGTVPNVTSLVELENLLGVGFADGGQPAFALLGHSSSLVSRFVSAINPRAILFTPPPADGSTPSGYVLLSYSRGDSFVEVAAHDPVLNQVVLYLVVFQSTCDASDAGCTPADRLTPGDESGWTGVTSYTAATEINDTILDCFQCHQPQGTQSPTLLRMQEINAPFTHFFSATTAGGRSLLADFHAAHGQAESYGGIPADQIDQSSPQLLAQLITAAGFGTQPNAFDSATIEAQVEQSAPAQPSLNLPAGTSPAWSSIYAQAELGNEIAVPYHDVKVTDPVKLAAASALYQSVQSGQQPPSALTDIRDVFLDEGVRDMGFAPAAGLDGGALLVQVCQQCHNSRLDQTISRALFNVQILSLLPASRKQAAIDRLNITDSTDPLMMPPPALRTLSSEERRAMIETLMQ
jgi:hypothetical protein